MQRLTVLIEILPLWGPCTRSIIGKTSSGELKSKEFVRGVDAEWYCHAAGLRRTQLNQTDGGVADAESCRVKGTEASGSRPHTM
jgi:hypothetical protein